MTDNVAKLDGFTKAVTAEGGDYVLFLLIRPDTDLDDSFKAWDCDGQEYLRVNGWLFTFEDGHEEATSRVCEADATYEDGKGFPA